MVAMPALFCGACGQKSSPFASNCACGAALREPEYPAVPCPACTVAKRSAGPLVPFVAEHVTLHGCATCRGVLVSARAWCTLMAEPARVPRLPEGPPGANGAVLELVHCPVCKKTLERGRYAGRSPVVVDLCERHGLWLDAGELAQLLAFEQEKSRGIVRPPEAPSALEMAMARGDQDLRAAATDLRMAGADRGRSSPLVGIAIAVLVALACSGAGYGYYRSRLSVHGESTKGAAEGAEKVLGR
jgi:Zn-finger nucleic acid-binding protein